MRSVLKTLQNRECKVMIVAIARLVTFRQAYPPGRRVEGDKISIPVHFRMHPREVDAAGMLQGGLIYFRAADHLRN